MNDALLGLEGISVRRGGRDVVRDVSLRVTASERVALVGPNAAGKSTLLAAIAGLIATASGTIRIAGREIASLDQREIARTIGLVVAVQETATRLSVAQSTELGRFPHVGALGGLSAKDHATVQEAIAETGLLDLRDRSLNSLSAGERQRALIARALAQQPRLLLLDEPSAHLDVGHGLELFELLTGIAGRGVGIVAVVHDLVSAARWATRMIVMHEGRIVDDGEPGRVMRGEALGRAFGVTIREARIVSGPDDPATWRFDLETRARGK